LSYLPCFYFRHFILLFVVSCLTPFLQYLDHIVTWYLLNICSKNYYHTRKVKPNMQTYIRHLNSKTIITFLHHCQEIFPDLAVYMNNTAGFLYEAGTEFIFGFLVGSVLLIFVCFLCVVLLCFFWFLVRCYDGRYSFRIKRCSVRIYFQLFVGGLMSYLCYLSLLAHSGVPHILCCVFLLFIFVLYFVYPMLPVSLDCPFGMSWHGFPLQMDIY
jgi:hypothetical protein